MIRFFADYVLLIVLAVGGVIAVIDVLAKRRWGDYARVAMAGLSSLLFAKLISLVYQTGGERPFELQGVQPGAAYIDNPGFPSDHALLAVGTIGAVYFLTRNVRLTGLLVILSLMMMTARVVALVHTPLDIVGGILAGLFGMLWYVRANHK